MKIKNDYINKINVLALIFITIYFISNIGYNADSSHKFIYVVTRLITNLGFPLLLMVMGSLMLKKHENPIDYVKKTYRVLLPPFIIWNAILGILILYFNGSYLFATTITKINWILWIIISNVLIVPILSEFIHFEKENGMKYLLAVFFITSILLTLSHQFNFSLYNIDLVFFGEPLCFMVLGYYLHTKEWKFKGKQIFIISSVILIVTLLLRIMLIKYGIAGWTAYFMKIFGTTVHLSIDPFVIIEVSAIFLMVKSLKGILNDNPIVKFYSKKTFSILLVLGIFTFILSKMAIKLSWIKLTIVSTIAFLIFAGILFYILDKIPFINKFC